jgi:hypothetical protein
MSSVAPTTSVPVPVTAPVAPTAAATAAGAVAGAPAIAVTPGSVLPVTPGQALAARVISVQAGLVELALAGGLVTAASDLPLEPGQTLRLVVHDAGTDRVTLRLAPETLAVAGSGTPVTPQSALAQAGVPASAATALIAALAEQGAELPTGAAATALAARAAAAGVSTPAQAAAFVRLMSADMPTTPAAVGGLAQLIDGAPLGRALATVLDAAAARLAATGTAPAPGTPGAPAPAATTPAAVPAAPGAPAAPTTPPVAAMPGAYADDALPATPAPPAGTIAVPGAPASPAPLSPTSTTVPATPGGPPAPPLADLVDALTQLARSIESGAVDGRGQALRQALADLGAGLEARLAGGAAPEHAPLRALLLALADHPAADASLGRAAAGLSDAIAAQSLAGPALAATVAANAGAAANGQQPDPSTQNGAYLQLPLPGGGTAEVRVQPDAGRDEGEGGSRPRRLAFLLHLSALGPVMIDATAGPAGVDATIRVGSDDVRAFLDAQAADLAAALKRSAPAASVRVERMATPAPERLLAPPPSSGLDIHA